MVATIPIIPGAAEPECDAEGICHCNIEQAQDTAKDYMPPNDKQRKTCACKQRPKAGPEYATVYTDQTTKEKYCVCFSALRD